MKQTMDGMKERHKIVVVGDGYCGKTSLLVTYVDDAFPEKYVPTIFETHVVQMQGEDGAKTQLILWDTAGQENYDMLRPISYPGTDVFIVCYSVDNPDSFYNVSLKWVPELRHFSASVPIVLVATKTDLRGDRSQTLGGGGEKGRITTDDGLAMSKLVGARGLVECSARLKCGVDEVFRAAAAAAMHRRQNPTKPIRKQCTIL